ncbi:lactoylglutathione lyase [Bacteroidia bacterium]|nr:lactoylglutathione lyase [Bacteroidia bacterium]
MINDYSKGVQHIGLPTNDMEATITFYKKLGFEVVHEKVIDCRVCFLQLQNLVIESYENKDAVLKSGAIDHIAIDCTNIEAVFAEVKKIGLQFEKDKIESLPFWKNGVKFFKIIGPNAELIEYCQIL